MRLFLHWMAVLCIAGAAFASDTSSLFLTENINDRAAAELVGSGIPLPDGRVSTAAADAHGRAIVWREHRRSNDEIGGQHVFYRQHLVNEGIDAELFGSDMGFHYDAEGRLTSVAGTQYTDVIVTNVPEIDAFLASARSRLAVASFARADVAVRDLDDPVRAARRGTLMIVPSDDGDLRYVWRVREIVGDGDDRTVYIDAQSERVLSTAGPARHNNCYPDTTSHVSAVGLPVRPGVSNRSIGATPLSYTRGVYSNTDSYEAFWAIGPLLAVHQQVNDSTYKCIQGTANDSYSLVAIRRSASTGLPTYNDTTKFKGRAAGDAIYHTRKTMQAFQTMGWGSWDGQYSNATVVIESTYALKDQARFLVPDHPGPSPTEYPNLPPGAAVTIGREDKRWNMAAALDVVAHEWGHGVTLTRVDFPVDGPNSTLTAQQLDEGFADVIGNIVERMTHPFPSTFTMQPGDADEQSIGLEQAGDWTIHEDVAGSTAGYARGAKDDGPGGHFYHLRDGTAGTAIKDRLHKDDPDVTAGGPHEYGNLLVVVLKLLTEGGKNPLCYRSEATRPAFCAALPTVNALGFTKARKILWDTLARVPRNAYWEDPPPPTQPSPSRVVGNHAMEAAFQLFKMCNASPVYVPVFEQQAVSDAFENIGFKPTQAVRTSCQ